MSSITDHGTLALPAAPAFTRATVCCGPVETGYRRAGRGETVVALAAHDWPAAPSLLPALARDFRVIVPDLLPHGDAGAPLAFDGWLTGFLDGLGLANVTLLADERFTAAALGFTLAEPVRVGRLVVVLDAAASDGFPGATDATLCGTGTRMRVTWMRPDTDWASEVAAALLGGCHMVG